MNSQADGDGPGTGTDVGQNGGRALVTEADGLFDQQFCLGAGYQHPAVYEKIQAARAHARAGDAAMIAGYLGEGDSFDEAVAQFALTYADQTTRDYARFRQAIADKQIEVVMEKR